MPDEIAPIRIFVSGRAMWRFADGTLLPVVSGGDGPAGGGGAGGGGGADPKEDPDDDDDDDDDKKLGPEGEKALTEWKRRARAAEKAQRDHEAELQKLQDEKKNDHEKAVDEAKRSAEKAARDELAPRLQQAAVENAILRAAHGKVADVDLTIAALRESFGELVDDDGDVDRKKVTKAIEKLIEEKPLLAVGAGAGGGTQPRPRPRQGADGGEKTANRTDAAWEAAAKRAGVAKAAS